jgi:hypothetical protein
MMVVAAPLCAQSLDDYRTSPALEARKSTITSLVLLTPKVEMVEVSAGGVSERMDEWMAQAGAQIRQAVLENIQDRRGITPTVLREESLSPEQTANLHQTWALYDAVETSILQHAYPRLGAGAAEFFIENVARFDYGLGAETGALAPGAEALLFVRVLGQRATGGRQAVLTGFAAMGLVFGSVVDPSGHVGWISLALVDAKTGTLLWHRWVIERGDVRRPEGARATVKELLIPFPRLG